jgi:hypothetical protein
MKSRLLSWRRAAAAILPLSRGAAVAGCTARGGVAGGFVMVSRGVSQCISDIMLCDWCIVNLFSIVKIDFQKLLDFF